MEFKLNQFAKQELKKYIVKTKGEYDIDNPQIAETKREISAIIYKSRERAYQSGADGGRVIGGLAGKCLKIEGLRINEVVVVESLEYKVVEVTPRIYADFVEFKLELMRNGK